MRSISFATAIALAGRLVPLAVLVEMDLTAPLNLNSANIDLTINGTTYLGTKGLGKVDPIRETAAESPQLRFELSGVPSAGIALALAEPVQGKAIRIKTCAFDSSTYQPLDVRLRWSGYLDVMSIDDGPDTATLSCTAEGAAVDLMRPITSLYSNEEQQRLYPGDLSFQYVTDQADMRVVWPSAAWGRK